MARRKTKTITRTVVAKAPTPTIRIAAPASIARARKRVHKHYRRARAGAGKLFSSSTPQLTAIAGAAGLGFLQKQGIHVPKLISSLSTPANAGIIAFAAGKLLKSTTLDHIATGMLSVAAWAYTGGAPIEGDSLMGTGVVYGDDEYYDYDY